MKVASFFDLVRPDIARLIAPPRPLVPGHRIDEFRACLADLHVETVLQQGTPADPDVGRWLGRFREDGR